MSKPQTLNLAVIGCGRIGQIHAENIARRIPGVKLAAVADVNLQGAQACAERLGVEKVYDDYKKILADSEIDAVVICSSTDTHSQIMEEAAKAGKHIFCEKPIDHSLSKIDRALAAVDKAGVKLQIGFNRRFDPNFHAVRQAILQGKLGELRILRITSRDPGPPPIEYIKVAGGMFLDMTIHDFDMARYLVGSEVKRVFAIGGVRVSPEIGEAGDIDTAVITLEFENGVMATIDNCREAVYGYDQRVEAFGSKGVMNAENNTPNRTVLGTAEGFQSPLPLNFFLERYAESYVIELREFVDSIATNRAPSVSGADGRVPVLMAMAAKRSLETGRPVDMRELADVAVPALSH